MDGIASRPDKLATKVAATIGLVTLAEIFVDGTDPGAIVGGFALAWLVMLLAARRTVLRTRAAMLSAVAATLFALVLIDDPNPLAVVMFGIALSLATLLPRRDFDDAITWAGRLVWHGLAGLGAPLRDMARIAVIRRYRGAETGGVRALARILVIPLGGGAVFLTLFAAANPLIDNAFAKIALPDTWIVVWRLLLATIVGIAVWTSLRPSASATRLNRRSDRPWLTALDPGASTLALSLMTFNAIFALQNGLDLAFLWSGAPLPAGMTMAEYAHRGAHALIVTALLAGLFVLVALRPGSAGATRPIVRRLVALWIMQTLLLVASSVLRTLDYVDAYGMTALRLAALAWMALVAIGLALIGWRLLTGRSAAWLINANAVAAAIVLALASVVDLGSTAAAWNARIALQRGRSGPPLDLCHMARLGPSALVSLAALERHARRPAFRDRLAWLRWQAQTEMVGAQANWRSWTPRAARRLATVQTIIGTRAPTLRPAPDGRGCDGSITPPDIQMTDAALPAKLTRRVQQ